MAFKTALVVDDSKSARFALRRFLENQYYKVETAESAEECYTVLQGLRPDVIFLDHVMPGADGLEVLRQLKSDAVTSDIRVVICSSHDSPEFVEQSISGGATAVLVKPPSADQLASILKQLDQSLAEPAQTPESFSVAYTAPANAAAELTAEVEVEATLEDIELQEYEAVIEQAPTPAPHIAPVTAPVAMYTPPPDLGRNQVTQSLSLQIAQLQAQAVQLQSRIDEEQVAARIQPDLQKMAQEIAQQNSRIETLEKLANAQFAELKSALERSLRAQNARIEQMAAAATERAREEAERTVSNATARISEQLTQSILTAIQTALATALAPHNSAEANPPGKVVRLQA